MKGSPRVSSVIRWVAGGYSAHKNLRLALSYFDMPLPGQPEVFLGQSASLFDEDGNIKEESTVEFLKSYIARFVELVDQRVDGTPCGC